MDLVRTSCESILFPKEQLWAELSERLMESVAEDPALADYISSDEDLGEEIEIMDPETVDPLSFNWDYHEIRIKDFLVKAIRAYSFKMKPVISTGEAKKRKMTMEKTDSRKNIYKMYNELIELIAHSKEVQKEIKLNRKRRIVKDLNRMVTDLYTSMDEEIQCLMDELYPIGNKLVEKWVKEKKRYHRRDSVADKEELERFLSLAVEREVERMVRRRMDRSEKNAQIKEMEPKARESRLTCILQVRRRKEKMRKWRKAGSKKYLAVTIYRKWRRGKRKKTLKDVRKLNRICKACKQKEKAWWREGDGWKQAGELSIGDAKKFQCHLFRSEMMTVLVDYLVILLKKPGLGIGTSEKKLHQPLEGE